MISWLLFGWPGQVALCVFAAWFAWGLIKAIKNWQGWAEGPAR